MNAFTSSVDAVPTGCLSDRPNRRGRHDSITPIASPSIPPFLPSDYAACLPACPPAYVPDYIPARPSSVQPARAQPTWRTGGRRPVSFMEIRSDSQRVLGSTQTADPCWFWSGSGEHAICLYFCRLCNAYGLCATGVRLTTRTLRMHVAQCSYSIRTAFRCRLHAAPPLSMPGSDSDPRVPTMQNFYCISSALTADHVQQVCIWCLTDHLAELYARRY